MRSWKKPTSDLIDRALRSVRKEPDRLYFFSRLKNPLWIGPLAERGYFDSPPSASHLPDGSTLLPHWPELLFLRNVCRDASDEVVNLILGLPHVDNPRVYGVVFDIVLALPGTQSARLKPKVLESADLEPTFLSHRYREVLVHWTEEGEREAAVELTEQLVGFVPDPEAEEKGKLYASDPTDFTTLLRPQPRLEHWDYQDFIVEGVQRLSENEPYEVSLILIRAVDQMIRLSLRPEHVQQGRGDDSSEIRYRRLRGRNGYYEQSDETLIFALTSACEGVFTSTPEHTDSLIFNLENQQWKVFKRLQQHLYALFPSEQTKSGIRNLILGSRGLFSLGTSL